MRKQKTLRVNLDAMFPRADFATLATSDETLARIIQELPLQQLESNGIYRHSLRKADFQRGTNHWTPEQVASLIQRYDHIERAKDGGRGVSFNGQLAHPYCNSGLKG